MGRGLSALLGPNNNSNSGGDKRTAPLDSLIPGKYQARREFRDAELQELSTSIREIGILQPILVRRIEGQDTLEIIAGERRWRAARLAGLSEVPITFRILSDDQACEAGLIENIQRDDLNALEEAEGYKRFMDEFSYTQDQLAKKLGKSRSYIANTLRLLNLSDSIKARLRSGQLSAGHARSLLNAENPEALAEEIVANKLNVREVEKRVKKKTETKKQELPQAKDSDLTVLEQQVSEILSTKTEIDLVGEQGVVKLYFRSLSELDRIISQLVDRTGTSRATPTSSR